MVFFDVRGVGIFRCDVGQYFFSAWLVFFRWVSVGIFAVASGWVGIFTVVCEGVCWYFSVVCVCVCVWREG